MKLIPILLLFLLVTAPAVSAPGTTEESVSLRDDLITFGLDLQYVPIQYKNYGWVDGQRSSDSGQGGHLALEWMPFEDRYGKVGFGVGLGFYAIRNVTFNQKRATLTTIPIEAFLSYRFDYVENQILVPFLKIGANTTFMKQRGIDVAGMPNYYGWDYAGGLELCLNVIDSFSARHLNLSTGINTTYLIFEYLRSAQLGRKQAPDLSHDEYRIGLRFEM